MVSCIIPHHKSMLTNDWIFTTWQAKAKQTLLRFSTTEYHSKCHPFSRDWGISQILIWDTRTTIFILTTIHSQATVFSINLKPMHQPSYCSSTGWLSSSSPGATCLFICLFVVSWLHCFLQITQGGQHILYPILFSCLHPFPKT